MTFSHVLQKNATVVVQTDLSLPCFLFLLHFGARISCVFSIAWSLFFLSAGHLWDITHLLHLLMILFLNSCGTFFFGCSVYSLSGIQLQLFPVSKEWNALVLIVRVSHHSFPGITSDRPTLTFYDQNFPSFSKQCFAGEIKAKHGASLPLKICICEKFTQIFSGHFTRKKQQSQQ